MATFTGSNTFFNKHPTDKGEGEIDYTTLTPECWLWTGTAPLATWEKADDITNEVNRANGYTPTALTGHTWTQSTNTAKLDSNPVEFTAAGGDITARGWILVLRNGTDANSPVISWGYLDNAGQNDKTVSPPDKIRITPNAANGWYISSTV